jgi:HEPN domain-containing protein
MFRDAADEDYLIARMAARSGLQFQYCWSSQQAIEKYLKAILLLNGQKINFNHDLLSMFGAVMEMTGEPISFSVI